MAHAQDSGRVRNFLWSPHQNPPPAQCSVVVGQYEPKPACERFRSVFRRQLAREDLPGLLSEDLLGWEPVLADVFKAEDQSLNFDGLALQSKAANLVFSVLRHSSALMHLDLSSNLLTDDDASTFALVCYALPHLRSLLLAGNQFSAKAVSAILSAPAPSSSTPKPFQALEELDLSYMSLDELSSSIGPSLHKIKRLNLSHCQLLPQNFRVAELLQTASSTLCHLSLAGNTELKFDAAARRAILSSHLRSLDVSSCYLDSDFFELASSVSEDEPPGCDWDLIICPQFSHSFEIFPMRFFPGGGGLDQNPQLVASKDCSEECTGLGGLSAHGLHSTRGA
eukprot:m.893149 g.893149  ORF g.893149 m.893149 type:complete len:338 (-) comp59975_c0_seq33:1093-2106(-)